jgi:hypothetical protein
MLVVLNVNGLLVRGFIVVNINELLARLPGGLARWGKKGGGGGAHGGMFLVWGTRERRSW